MNRANSFKWLVVLSLAASVALFNGCKKSDESGVGADNSAPMPGAPKQPTKTTAPKIATTKPGDASAPAPLPTMQSVSMKSSTPADQRAAELERRYNQTPDFGQKIEIVYKLASQETAEAVKVMSKLFTAEKDEELKIHLVDSLVDIEGHEDVKLEMLRAAILPDQPQDVRESAIDAIVDLESPKGIPILEALVNDSNEEVREWAKDSLDVLKELLAENK